MGYKLTKNLMFRKQLHENPILPRYDTVSMCNFFWRFQTTIMVQHFRHRVSGGVVSYIEGKKPHTHSCENIQFFIYHAILKCVNFLSGSTGNKSDLYSGAPRNESWSGNGLSLLK